MQITQASLTDLEQIVAIERAGFTPEEAGSRQAFIDRINHFPETFLVAKVGDTVLGFICGPALVGDVIEDWMYEPGFPPLLSDGAIASRCPGQPKPRH